MSTFEKQITIRLPEDLLLRLDEIASTSGEGRSTLVRRAIRIYLAKRAFESDRPYDRFRDLVGSVEGGPPVPE